MKPGDLVEYAPFTRTRTHGYGFGIVLQLQLSSGPAGHDLAQVLWAKYPGDGPQWYQVRNLLVASSTEEV